MHPLAIKARGETTRKGGRRTVVENQEGKPEGNDIGKKKKRQ
jgi:hypothetical protein